MPIEHFRYDILRARAQDNRPSQKGGLYFRVLLLEVLDHAIDFRFVAGIQITGCAGGFGFLA